MHIILIYHHMQMLIFVYGIFSLIWQNVRKACHHFHQMANFDNCTIKKSQA